MKALRYTARHTLPLRAGMTLPTALAAPVLEGMMLAPAPRPPRQSLPEGPSTVFWVAVLEKTSNSISRLVYAPKLAKHLRGVDSGHESFDDTILIVDDLGKGSQTLEYRTGYINLRYTTCCEARKRLRWLCKMHWKPQFPWGHMNQG